MERKKYRNKDLISSREGAEKVQKQGRDERTQEYYLNICKNTQQMYSLLAVFHLCLVSVLFSAPSLLEIKVYKNFFPLFLFFFQWFLTKF